jgi:apolipoprotein N-acyltransferase
VLSVCIIQPNIPQAEKWRPENRDKIITKMLSLTRQAARRNPGLVVWPEASLPLLLERKPLLRGELQQIVDQSSFTLLLGGPRYLIPAGGKRKRLYNAIFCFRPHRPVATYDKVKLVPYGEFTPLAEFFPFIGKLVPGLNYSAGSKIRLFALPDYNIAPSICFEGVFPAFTARFFAAGANLLVNLTNDAWFGDSPGPRQHLLNIRLRALENRTWIVRCANTGISAVIDPAGRIIKHLPLNQAGILDATLHPASGPTFYARHPSWPLFAAGLLLLFFGACRRMRKRRRPTSQSRPQSRS